MKTYQCKILNLKSYRATEEDGDEIYIKQSGKKIFPVAEKYFKIKSEETFKLGFSIKLNKLGSVVELELWEYDNIFSKELIGSFLLHTDEVGGPFTTDLTPLKNSMAKYCLTWGLAEDNSHLIQNLRSLKLNRA